MADYTPDTSRYERMQYRRAGNSGIMLPEISLGLWHNFGDADDLRLCTRIITTAFDNGITHFDLANNYGPEPGAAERNFGRILRDNLRSRRDELLISTKAGYYMWEGPYGDFGSRKYLMASIDQSLKRMGLEYVDIFYSHRYDPETPLEETMGALSDIVRQGKALYVGLSNYRGQVLERALDILAENGTPCLLEQSRYSMLVRGVEEDTLPVLERAGVGMIAFSPLAQGLLTDRYIGGIPDDSRIAKGVGFLRREHLTEPVMRKVSELNEVAARRGQTLAEMALAWLLRDGRVTSVLVGASSPEQLIDNIKATESAGFDVTETEEIEAILADE
ncbi:MAG: aldo/keto reductase [Alistipes sp.]|nr:aldo/keto reductase [Alistipes sp.]